MCHYQLGPATENRQQLVHEAPLRIVARDHGLENVGVADALDAAERLLPFQAIDDRLHSRVSGSAKLGKRLLNLSNGARTLLPECFQHLNSSFVSFGLAISVYYG